MANWIIPAFKAVLPHIGTIISAAKPIFRKRRQAEPAATAGTSDPVAQDIAELQAAVSQNDALIRELAQQLQTLVAALEQASLAAEAKSRRVFLLSVAALFVSVATALFVFLH